MIAKTPIPVRWSEIAEAKRICTLALLESEPQTPTARVIKVGEVVASAIDPLAHKLSVAFAISSRR